MRLPLPVTLLVLAGLIAPAAASAALSHASYNSSSGLSVSDDPNHGLDLGLFGTGSGSSFRYVLDGISADPSPGPGSWQR